MKVTKKVLAVILALVMVMALSSVTAFATSPTITITDRQSNPSVQIASFTANVGETVYNALETRKTTLNLTLVWSDVQDYYNPSVYHKALVSLNGLSSTPAAHNDSHIQNPQSITWLNTPGYGLLGTQTVNGVTSYHYVYVGYDWVYGPLDDDDEIKDNWLYMDQYVVATDERIAIEYSFQQSDWWSTNIIN